MSSIASFFSEPTGCSLSSCCRLLRLRCFRRESSTVHRQQFYDWAGGDLTVPDIFDALGNAAGYEDQTTVIRAVGGKDFQDHYENRFIKIHFSGQTR